MATGRVSEVEVIHGACFDPGRYVKREFTDSGYGDGRTDPEPLDSWRARAVLVALGEERYGIVHDDFISLVRVAQRMLDAHYPEDVFGSGPLSLDAGARFTNKLREALRCVHAEVEATPALPGRGRNDV